MNNATPKNLYLDSRIVKAAETLVEKKKKTMRAFSLSQLVQQLLVTELHANCVSLPKEFSE